MAKQGMARPDWTHTQPHNTASPVPEIQGKAKHGHQEAPPVISGTSGPQMKVYHQKPLPKNAYRQFGSDLAQDNPENDIPAADLEDM